MADSDESEIDDEFIKIFEDSDDENEFEGFGTEDLIPDYEILREIDLQQSLKDRNVQQDDDKSSEKRIESNKNKTNFQVIIFIAST
jgi:hypothetical protein